MEFALGIFLYAAKLSKRGVDVSVSELAGAGHEILLDTRVRNAIKSTLAEL